MNRFYRAPWGKELRITTLVIMAILILGMVIVQGVGLFALAATLIASYLFFIRGYSIQNGSLVVHGLLWSKSYALKELLRAEARPFLLTGARRQGVLGGIFSHLGYYRSTELGNFLSFATNSANTVVLDFGGKLIVISPEDPEGFVTDVLIEYRHIRHL